jgi:hypothetical protein
MSSNDAGLTFRVGSYGKPAANFWGGTTYGSLKTNDVADTDSLYDKDDASLSYGLANKAVSANNGNDAMLNYGLGLTNNAAINPWGNEGGPSSKGFLADAASWAGDKDNQALVGMGLGASRIGLGLASYLQSSDLMKKQSSLLDQQIANNEYVMNNRKQFSNALANAVNQTK